MDEAHRRCEAMVTRVIVEQKELGYIKSDAQIGLQRGQFRIFSS